MHTAFRFAKCALLVIAPLCAVAACGQQKLIPQTAIPDTPLNREVLQVVEQYRQAMEGRDAARILMLVHPTYQDTAGTPEPNDDLDYEGLKRLLTKRFGQTDKVRYRIDYQAITFNGREAIVDAWIDATFLHSQAKANPRYRRFADYNRYHLLKEGQYWRFASGL